MTAGSAVTGFSAEWLHQREPFDAAARRAAATALDLAPWLAALRANGDRPCHVIDLACGTGSNLRVLAPQLGAAQHWLAVDHDRELLARWPAAQGASDIGNEIGIETRVLDLARDLEALPFDTATLVTASALIDLVGEPWLVRLAAACSGSGAAVLLALSVDGRHQWSPVDADDGVVAALFEAHQRRDKGFGPALGPRGAAVAADVLGAAGYRVDAARSDWWLDARAGAAHARMIASLIDGMAAAAIDQDTAATSIARAWQRRRHALALHTTLLIGHVDLIGTPRRG